MFRPLLLLTALLVLALPVTASAVKRPEHTACSLSGVPKRMSMQKAFAQGIPATYTCHVEASPLVTVMFADNNVKLSAEDRMASIAHSSPPPIPAVPAGTTRTIRLKIQKDGRRAMRGHRRVRLLVEIASSLSGERGPFYSAGKYGRIIHLER